MPPAMDRVSGADSQRDRSSVTPARGDWRSALGRSGLAAKGVLYSALGLIAIQVAAGDSTSNAASSRGAIELVASQPFGQWLLGLLTAGLVALALWQIVLAVTGDPVEGSDTKDRLKFGGKALLYGTIAATALSILVTHGGGSSGQSQDRATATVMGWPGGEWIVGLIGVGAIAVGLYELSAHAWKLKFMRRLDRTRMSGTVRTGVERAGRTGYAAKGIVALIVGLFLIVAAVQHNPQEAVGLSGALQALAGQPWGQAVLWLVAIGLLLYGFFCFAEAKYRRAT